MACVERLDQDRVKDLSIEVFAQLLCRIAPPRQPLLEDRDAAAQHHAEVHQTRGQMMRKVGSKDERDACISLFREQSLLDIQGKQRDVYIMGLRRRIIAVIEPLPDC